MQSLPNLLTLARTMCAVAITGVLASAGVAQAFEPVSPIQKVGYFKKKSCETCESAVIGSAPSAAPGAAAMPAPDAAPMDTTTDVFSPAFAAATTSAALAPNMIGDSLGYYSSYDPYNRAAQRYKVADNNVAIPRSRVYYGYNYFHDVYGSSGDIHRSMGGGELAFLDGNMSVDVRSSLNSFTNFGNLGLPADTEFGNLVTTIKGLAINDGSNYVSGGLAIQWPTGGVPFGLPNDVYIFSPYIAYLYASADSPIFLQGFMQLDVPSYADDQLLMHTDASIGYWIRRFEGGLITGIAPTAELHLYTPVGGAPRGSFAGLNYQDVLNATLGTTFLIRDQATLALGCGFPITNSRDYNVEAQLQFNWFFGAGR